MKSVRLLFLLCALCLAAAPWADAQVKTVRRGAAATAAGQRVQGTMIGIGGRWSGRSLPFTLIINNYSSADDVARLNAALRSGQDELLSALTKLDAGRIAVGNNVGVTANAIIATPTAEGGTRLTVLFERALGLYELRYGTRSSDYRFGYAEIFLDRAGRGQGTFIPAAKVRLEGENNWVVEDFGVYPARLMGLRSSGTVGGAR